MGWGNLAPGLAPDLGTHVPEYWLAHLGPRLGYPGPMLAQAGPMLTYLGPVLAHLGAKLDLRITTWSQYRHKKLQHDHLSSNLDAPDFAKS